MMLVMDDAGPEAHEKRFVVMCGPSPDSRGGISSVIETYQRTGILDGLHVEMLATYRDGATWRKVVIWIRALATLLYMLIRRRVRLVHLHAASRTSFVRKSTLAILCAVFRVPAIIHIHSGNFVEYATVQCGWLGRRYIRLILNSAAMVVALTGGIRARLQKDVGVTTPIAVLANPTPVDTDTPIVASSSKEGLRVLFLGGLTAGKGLFNLLAAMRLVRDAGVPIHLRCGGQGDARAVEVECQRLGIGADVSLLGWISAEARHWELQEADILALPSLSEGQPMAIIEAMTIGRPVVATRVGGIPDTVRDGEEGLLVEPGDVQGLADAMISLARDPALLASLGRRAYVRARQCHSPRTIQEGMREIYASVRT